MVQGGESCSYASRTEMMWVLICQTMNEGG